MGQSEERNFYTRIFCVFIILFVAAIEGCWFFLKKYFDGISLDSIIFTCRTMAIGTVDTRLVKGFFLELVYSYAVGLALLIIMFCPLNIQIRKRRLFPVSTRCALAFSLFLLLGAVIHVAVNLDIPSFLYNRHTKTDLYEKYYMPPENATVKFPEHKRNLILVYLESIENTYLSKKLGGGREYNLIPNLGALASENINFSHSDAIGGPESLKGTDWTVGAMFGSMSGIPLSIPIGENELTGMSIFAPGATTLGDILKDNGYSLTFLMGSDSAFGGRKDFLQLHGGFDVLDYEKAIEDGVIPRGYRVWWGFEDKYLYSYAKDTLLRLQKDDAPFCLMLLTVDTHFPNGYVCSECGDKFPMQYENVISCADRQIKDFIDWVKRQDFYDDTTVVIIGDHCSMDRNYFKDLAEGYTRRPYNVFINSAIEDQSHVKNRTFTTLDYYPTLLASIGAEIDGERLGLGTNLFSGKPTLPEEIGIDKLREELAKKSDYYYDKILFGEQK